MAREVSSGKVQCLEEAEKGAEVFRDLCVIKTVFNQILNCGIFRRCFFSRRFRRKSRLLQWLVFSRQFHAIGPLFVN